MIYFDNAASTKVDKSVSNEIINYLENFYANPSSTHAMGRKVRNDINCAKQKILDSINAKNCNVFFTQSATECNNIAICKLLDYNINKGKHIVCSNIEHSSITETLEHYKMIGYDISYVEANNLGIIESEKLKSSIREDTSLVIIMHVNNEVGSIQDIKTLSRIAHDNGSLFYSDTVQSIGHCNFDFADMNVDGMCISAHKIHGPKGIAALILKNKITYSPYIYGGGQQNNLISGTENSHGIIGLAKAVSLAKENLEKNIAHIFKLKEYLIDCLNKSGIHYKLNTPSYNSVANIISIRFYDISNSILVNRLDMMGICISAGSACSSGSVLPSQVIINIDDLSTAKETIRISFSKYNTHEEIDYLVDALKKIILPIQNMKR